MKQAARDGRENRQTQNWERLRSLEDTIAHIEASVAALPQRCRPHLGNALLNLALGALVDQYGQVATAQLLGRVQDTLASSQCPTASESALDPFQLHG